MAAVTIRDNGETRGSLLSLLSFNKYHVTSLTGLPTLLHAHCPCLVFFQEVTSHVSLCAMVAVGFTIFLSTSVVPPPPPNGPSLLLAHIPAQVSALMPGYTQLVLLGDLSFIHLRLPSGG
jgi:hypothetical protein